MEISSHPTVDELGRAIRERGGNLSCPICGREEFSLDEVAVMGAGAHERYGTHRLRRVQLTCGNCGCVMAFDLERLRSSGAQS